MPHNLRRLSMLIDENKAEIIDQWKVPASKLPRAQRLDELLLLDHMPQLLQELSSALINAYNSSMLEMRAHESAREHGAIRFQLGFDVEEVIAEFGLLRDVIQEFAEAHEVNISGEVNRTVNRVIDKAIAVSLETYVRQQTEEIQRRRQEYLSFVVHDLKTPIAAMSTATHVIDKKLGASVPLDVRKMLDLLRRNSDGLNHRVLEIINEESRLKALTAHSTELPLQCRDIDLWAVVENLKADCQSIAESQADIIRNDVPHDMQVFADPDLLVEVLQNLLSNALKYTNAGEIVVAGHENATSIVCSVTDTGIGIPADQLKQVFQKGTGDPKVAGSTGIGLTLVDKVMQLHGGKVSVESTPGKGSTFSVEFPKDHRKAA